MKTLMSFVLAVGLAISLSTAASASTVVYDFTVNVANGPLSGETINGSFAYDSSSIVPGGTNFAAGLLTELNFSLNGITYSAATANTGFLSFDSTGALTFFQIGNNCLAAGCSLNAGLNQWYIVGFGTNSFAYAVLGYPGESFSGDVVLSQSGVPEPAMWAMLLAGFFGIGAMIRGRKRLAAAGVV